MDALKHLVWLIRAVYTTIVILMATWIGKHTGGLEWYPLAGFFNYHPLMMTLAFTVFMCEAVLAYKVAPGERAEGAARAKRKVAHMVLHGTALLLVVLGLSAIFLNHHCKKKHEADACERNPPLYTLHSLSGIITASLFAVQAVGGFYSYWMRASSSAQWKTDLLPFHRIVGLATFFMGLATMCMGLTEKEWLLVAFGGISKHGVTMHMANAIGVLVLALAFLVALYHGTPKAGSVEAHYGLMGAA